jgi:hypothetical protein
MTSCLRFCRTMRILTSTERCMGPVLPHLSWDVVLPVSQVRLTIMNLSVLGNVAHTIVTLPG